MSPTGQGEGDILKLWAESKLEGCQLVVLWIVLEYDAEVATGQYSNGTTSYADPLRW